MLSDLNEILSARKTEVITYKTLDFTAELQHVLQSISQTVAEEDLKVSHDFSQQSKINCSPVVIQSVLLNLITNAIKYKKPGTHPEIFLQTILSGEFLVLKVTDKGVGINLHKHGERFLHPTNVFIQLLRARAWAFT